MESTGDTDPGIAKFWQDYMEMLKCFPVPPKSIPWYRRHIVAFLADHPKGRLRSHSDKSVVDWLERSGRVTNIYAWQYRQKVDALRVL